jgi:hypothetical protein
VTLVRGKSITCQAILPLSQAMPPLYEIRGPATSQHANGSPVVVGSETGAALLFTTMDTAIDAAEWMTATPANRQLGTTRIYAAGGEMTAQRFNSLIGTDHRSVRAAEICEGREGQARGEASGEVTSPH